MCSRSLLVVVMVVVSAAAVNILTDPAIVFKYEKGFFGGDTNVWYYNMGSNTKLMAGSTTAPQVSTVWIPVIAGVPVVGQNAIFDSLPGDDTYSDLHAVKYITAPAGYVANTWKSRADITAAAAPTVRQPDKHHNMVLVPAGSSLYGAEGAAFPLMMGYSKGTMVHYFDFGVNAVVTDSNEAYIVMDAAGKQIGLPVFEKIPTSDVYYQLCLQKNILAPAGYVADTIRSDEQGEAAGGVSTTILQNLPVIKTALAPTGPAAGGATRTSAAITSFTGAAALMVTIVAVALLI